MLRFVTLARLAQIKADAREQGRKEALAEYKQLAQVVKTAKPIAAAERNSSVLVNSQPLQSNRSRKSKNVRQTRRWVRNDAPGIRMADDGKAVYDYVVKHVGAYSYSEIAKGIKMQFGDYLRGKVRAIEVSTSAVSHIVNSNLVYLEHYWIWPNAK